MNNFFSNGFIKGLAIGLGVSAAGFYMYKKNEKQVNSFLNKHGICNCDSGTKDFSELSLEELMETKEDIEDLIAEKEMNFNEDDIVTCTEEDLEDAIEA